jgi:hypothetical protein
MGRDSEFRAAGPVTGHVHRRLLRAPEEAPTTWRQRCGAHPPAPIGRLGPMPSTPGNSAGGRLAVVPYVG